MRCLAVTLTVLGGMLLSAPLGASAQVVQDPDGPAGKEYAIPFKEARENSRPKRDGDEAPAPGRFGEGIGGEAETATSEESSSGSTKDKSKSGKSSKDSSDEADAIGVPSSSGGGSSGGSGGTGADNSAALLTGGIALAVLLIGGAVALMARRTATDDI